MAHGLDLVETEHAAAPAASAGGGKDPDFWRAFEEGEVKVIGDEPANTAMIRVVQRKLCREAKEESTRAQETTEQCAHRCASCE